jgi:hypothetical protein
VSRISWSIYRPLYTQTYEIPINSTIFLSKFQFDAYFSFQCRLFNIIYVIETSNDTYVRFIVQTFIVVTFTVRSIKTSHFGRVLGLSISTYSLCACLATSIRAYPRVLASTFVDASSSSTRYTTVQFVIKKYFQFRK